MKWILLLFIVNSWGSSSLTAEFNSKESCEVAISKAKELYGTYSTEWDGRPTGAVGHCLPK